jgi:hypothetical protein
MRFCMVCLAEVASEFLRTMLPPVIPSVTVRCAGDSTMTSSVIMLNVWKKTCSLARTLG